MSERKTIVNLDEVVLKVPPYLLIDDPDFGTWPNSLGGGLAYVGVTVEAGLDGFDIAATVLDQTNPGVHLLSTQTQAGNNLLSLSILAERAYCSLIETKLDKA